MTKRDTPIDGELEEISIGDRMYRVIDDVTPDDTDDGWVVQVRTVRAVTKRTFSLDRPFSYCLQSHGRMSHGVVGRIMFASEAAAVRDFLDKATRGRDGARRQLAEADRMVEWAERFGRRHPHRPWCVSLAGYTGACDCGSGTDGEPD